MRSINEDKDLGEVYDAIEGVLGAALGPDKLTNLTAQLPKLVAAADGFDKALGALKENEIYESAGAFAGRLAKTIVYTLKKGDDDEAA